MNNSLLQLRDIHEPASIGFFPLALGWWILIGLLVILLFAFFGLRKYINNPKRKLKTQALKEFQRIKVNYAKNADKTLLLESISSMLRKITLSYFPEKSRANLTGDGWLVYLDSMSRYPIFQADCGQVFSGDQYKKTIVFDDQYLLNSLEQWVTKLQ